MYVPFTQHPYPSMLNMQFALRTTVDATQLARPIQAAVKEEDPELPIANLHPISELLENSMASVRFSVMLLGAFAAIAWLLALLGVYAIISYLVSERLRDLAIRVALGAQRRDVLALVFASGARLVAAGLGAGIVLALSLSRLLAHFVYQIRAVDPITYIDMSVLVFAAASIAILVPAQRAMRADPMTVLRAE
jgi:putative ABC transport system permease protein